jgi:hypothetical protein
MAAASATSATQPTLSTASGGTGTHREAAPFMSMRSSLRPCRAGYPTWVRFSHEEVFDRVKLLEALAGP